MPGPRVLISRSGSPVAVLSGEDIAAEITIGSSLVMACDYVVDPRRHGDLQAVPGRGVSRRPRQENTRPRSDASKRSGHPQRPLRPATVTYLVHVAFISLC